MIRQCNNSELEMIYEIINQAAEANRSIIPPDRWSEPYMSKEELQEEIRAGVTFWGYEEAGELAGVMGIQQVQDITLIRHAYVRPSSQRKGIGETLLVALRQQTNRPILVGTWARAAWAIRFYEKNGFRLLSTEEKDHLLRRYWSISEYQIETSVVLADRRWSVY